MPKDVPIGEGYTGEAMVARFPGQYRDPEREIVSHGDRAYHTPEFPGSASAPSAVISDPDQGRQMVTRDIPGVGIVSVPASDLLAQATPVGNSMTPVNGPVVPPSGSGQGAISPVEHEMAGLEAMGHHILKHGEAGSNLAAYASSVARTAVRMVRFGQITSVAEVESFIRTHVETMAARMEKALNRQLARLQKIKAYAIEQAILQATPVATKLLAGGQPSALQPGIGLKSAKKVGDWTGTMFAGGVGGLTEATASLFAGKEMNELAKGFRKLNDRLTEAFQTMPELATGYSNAKATISMAPIGPGIPVSPLTQNAMEAKAAAAQGLKAITGFNYITEAMRRAIQPNYADIKSIFPAIDAQLRAMANFDKAFMERVGKFPEFVQLWDQIQNRHTQLYFQMQPAAKTPDPTNPLYLKTAVQAVEELTGVRVDTPGQVGMGAIGVIGLIVTIVIAIATVVVAVQAVAFMKEYNFKGRALLKNQQDYEARMEEQRKAFMLKCGTEGTPVAECEQKWHTAKARADAGQKVIQDDLANRMPSPPGVGWWALPAAGVAAAVIVVPKLLGWG